MAAVEWGAPSARSSNFLGVVANSLANGSESTAVVYDNISNKDLYGAVTLKLGSITPATGGGIQIRVTISDGTDAADRAGGDVYQSALSSGVGAKVVIFPLVRLYPFSLRISVINASGATLAASGNEIYLTPYNEDVT